MSKKIVIKVNNQEFDYEKLADAIVNAEKKADEIVKTENKNVQVSFKEFLHIVWCIITNKKQTNGTMTSGMLAVIMSGTFNLLAILATILAIVCFCSIGHFVKNNIWTLEYLYTNILQVGVCIFGGVISSLFALILRGSANEISVEQDRNYIVSVFSAIVGFAALVIALIALLKGGT